MKNANNSRKKYLGMEYILPTGTAISFYMHTKSIRI